MEKVIRKICTNPDGIIYTAVEILSTANDNLMIARSTRYLEKGFTELQVLGAQMAFTINDKEGKPCI